MKIGVIGAGNVGGTLAKGWAKVGHKVILGVRDTQTDRVKSLLDANQNISAKSVQEAADEADVILIALPVGAVVETPRSLGDLQGRVIIDATNSFSRKPEPYLYAAEALKTLTNCKDVVKCFNSRGYENMAHPKYDDVGVDMFVAGNSQKRKEDIDAIGQGFRLYRML